jgi:hypothetical protein
MKSQDIGGYLNSTESQEKFGFLQGAVHIIHQKIKGKEKWGKVSVLQSTSLFFL